MSVIKFLNVDPVLITLRFLKVLLISVYLKKMDGAFHDQSRSSKQASTFEKTLLRI